ncbi:MAG: M20/M25/M40 family metallo-hydrolase [Flavobacteriales bacterium]|nr:M20/M25/M40 family metallo-hydrolase [Flavobacteriales bacterium]
MKKILLGLLFISSAVFAQDCKTSKESISNIKADVEYLADDKLEGRETGTKGEQLALEYLGGRLKSIGVETKVHKFKFNGNVKLSFWTIASNMYPTKYSSNGSIEKVEVVDVQFGIEAADLEYSDYSAIDVKGKAVVINTSSPDGIHPHSKYLNYHDLKLRAETAKLKGAVAVIFYTDNKYAESPERKFKNLYSVGIPVLFFDDVKENLPTKISVEVKLKEQIIEGQNLIAEVNNGKENTIIIGAHYDHLGWGAEGSLYRGEPAIHNGADDNASGTAGLLELAKTYSKSKYNNYNYLFIAFSGEEKGLLGSNAFAKSDMLEASKINYMINMDMIGRLNEDGKIEVYGTGTSPRWNSLLEDNKCKNVTIASSESGVGSSDHTSFYLQDIPVLHFFTGTHADYHKPTDDADKVNFKGIATVVTYIENLINDLDDEKKLEFTKTKSGDSKKAPKFSVTLGVVPDYLYSEGGMRIDGVNDGKPAQNAGMKKGDIVVKLGEVNITDMMAYMKALGHFVKGDKVKATVIRDGKAVELEVQF